MEGVREIAKSYYERASEDEKRSIEEFFNKLDVDGDGRISLKEFKKAVSSWLCAEAVFEKLDTNNDGSLDFEEFVCLHYMEKKVRIGRCGGCWDLLVGPYFSCLLCVGRGRETYDLCCSCYRHDLPHEHSSKYMLDHHSLLMVFRNQTAAAKKDDNKDHMEELRKIAKAHYRAGSPEVQALAYEFYVSMDTDGDGRVDLSEFLAFMEQQGYPYMQNSHFFEQLDVDGNGALDFSEVMTLYYIIKSGRPFCDSCGSFISGVFFSCVECFRNAESQFHLCGDCYQSGKSDHDHGGRSQFLDNYTLLQATRDRSLASASEVNSIRALRDQPLAHASEVNSIRSPPSNVTTNAVVPDRQYSISIHNSYPTYNTYVQPSNAIVPASSTNWNKWGVALKAFEVGLSIGTISTMCTIL